MILIYSLISEFCQTKPNQAKLYSKPLIIPIINLAFKKYPNLTFNMLNLLVYISNYGNFAFMSADLYSCTADLTSPLDRPWETTPIWPLICWISWCISPIMAIFASCQLICKAAQLVWPHHWTDLEKLSQFDL